MHKEAELWMKYWGDTVAFFEVKDARTENLDFFLRHIIFRWAEWTKIYIKDVAF